MANIRKTKTGYQATIRLKDLKPIYKTFPTKRLATAFVREVEGDAILQKSLGRVIKTVITFDDFLLQYELEVPTKDGARVNLRKLTFVFRYIICINNQFQWSRVL